MNIKIILGLILTTFIISCNSTEQKIDTVGNEIENAEKSNKQMTSSDWKDLEVLMDELDTDLEMNRENYTDEEIKEIGRLQGRYTSLILKKGVDDFKESMDDLGNQMEGFVEGLETDNENNE